MLRILCGGGGGILKRVRMPLQVAMSWITRGHEVGRRDIRTKGCVQGWVPAAMPRFDLFFSPFLLPALQRIRGERGDRGNI